MLRLFTGIALPENVGDRLMALQTGLPGARWVPFDNFHLTLAFIGDADRRNLDDIDAALSVIDAPAFALQIAGCDYFGDRKPRAVWAGAAPSDPLMQLQAKVAASLRRAGVKIETRKFKPHVTLAYVKGISQDEAEQWCAQNALASERPFSVAQFHLYASHLGGEGAYYEILESYSLSFSR